MKNITPDFSFISNVTFINFVVNKTKNLQINKELNNQFSEIISDMDEIFIKFTNLNITLTKIIDFFDTFLEKSKLFPDNYRFFNYSSLLTDIFKNYINKTHSSLNKLSNIITMISVYNKSILNDIEIFKTDMKNQLNKANELIDHVIIIAKRIENILESDKINIIQKINLLTERRDLLSNFEIELKYIPQLFFNSEKILRNLWYKYEGYVVFN